MKTLLKKILILTILPLSISNQTLQAAPWSLSNYLPKFNFSMPSISPKALYAVGILAATSLLSYGAYTLWPWQKATQPITPLAPTPPPGSGLDAALYKPTDKNKYLSSFKRPIANPASSPSAACAADDVTPDQDTLIKGLTAASQIAPKIKTDDERLKNYTNLLTTEFKIENIRPNGMYLQLWDGELFNGSRNNHTALELYNLGRANDQIEYRKQLVLNYKIHLMPCDNDMELVIRTLLNAHKNDANLRDHTFGIKIMFAFDAAQKQREIMPHIVIYTASSKESAQYVLNTIYNLFNNQEGLGITPRYNQKITSLLYYAQGDADHKSIVPEYFEEPDLIHYRSNFTGEERNFKLINPRDKLPLGFPFITTQTYVPT